MYVSPVDFESFLSPTLLIFTRIMGAIMAVRGKKKYTVGAAAFCLSASKYVEHHHLMCGESKALEYVFICIIHC